MWSPRQVTHLPPALCGIFYFPGIDTSSGAAKVALSPESCILLRKHETLHKCSMVPKDYKTNRPHKFASPDGRHIDFQYGT